MACVLPKSNRSKAQGDARINDKDKTCGKTTEILWYFQNTDIRKIASESKLNNVYHVPKKILLPSCYYRFHYQRHHITSTT